MHIPKKILFISPTPTHPCNAGNRKGILNLVDFFKRRGDEVSFCFLELEDYSFEDMNNHFSGKLFIIPKNEIYSDQYDVEKSIMNKFCSMKYWFFRLIGLISSQEYRFNSTVDFLINKKIKIKIKKIAEQKWDMVVCEYVWLSRLLTCFPDSVLKLIDTHDRFSNRYLSYLKMNSTPEWVSLFETEEIKGLKRADIVIALNPLDELYFRSKTKKEVVRFYYVPEKTALSKRMFDFTLLYFASSNISNIKSINDFINNIYPSLCLRFNKLRLLIGGSISSDIKINHSNVNVLGAFEDPASFYQLGDIVINPEIAGTGYKIKSMEALSYGLPVISSKSGALGICNVTDDSSCPLLLADSINEYLIHILSLADPEIYKQYSLKALAFVEKEKSQSIDNFSKSIKKFS